MANSDAGFRRIRKAESGNPWNFVRFHGPSDDDGRCAAVWMPEKKKTTDVAVSLIESVWAKLDDVQFSWIRLLHLAWFWRVESSSRAAPTQPMTQQLIDSQTVRGKDSDMTAFKFSCQLLAV